MSLKAVSIIVFFTVLVTAVITYFVTRQTVLYDPMEIPELLNLKHEIQLKDSLNNEIIDALKMRIEDKQYIIDNILQKQIQESENRVKYYSGKRENELKQIESFDEIQLQSDINSKILRRRN